MNEDDMKGHVDKKLAAQKKAEDLPEVLKFLIGVMVILFFVLGITLQLWGIVAIIKGIIGWL